MLQVRLHIMDGHYFSYLSLLVMFCITGMVFASEGMYVFYYIITHIT